MEEEWLKETFCKDPADNQRHNIAEVPLKDMFCTGDVTDKPSARVSSNTNLNAYSAIYSPPSSHVHSTQKPAAEANFLARKRKLSKERRRKMAIVQLRIP